MLREKYTNAIATALDGAINNIVTTVDVDDASTFPDAGFSIVVESEIMYVTSRASNALTVLRAQEGTSAAAHADDIPVNHSMTKGSLDRFRLGILADAGLVPYDDSLSADDDEFDDESFSGWTFVGTTPTLTTIEKSHRFSILIPPGTANAQHYAWMKAKVPSAGDWVQAGFTMMSSGVQFPIPNVIIADGATYNSGNQVMLCWSPQESKFYLRDTTGYNAHVGADNYGDPVHNYPHAALHLRLEWNSSNNYDLYHSADGVSWARLATGVTRGSVGTPSHMGFGVTSWGSTRDCLFSFLYCRFSF